MCRIYKIKNTTNSDAKNINELNMISTRYIFFFILFRFNL